MSGIRIVIYPLFPADEEATDSLLESLADALVAAHGVSSTEDDTLRSIIVAEKTDEDVGSEEWVTALAQSKRALRIVLPGAADEDDG